MAGTYPREQRGQTLVEFALGAILLFTLVFGIVEFGRLIYAFSAVHNAAREGARYLAVHPDADETALTTVAQRLAVGVPITLDFDPPGTGDLEVIVTANHAFDGIILPDFALSAEARQFREVM